MLAALSTMHGLVPPHPGPIAVVDELHADIGKTLVYSLIVGIPTAIIAGPLLAGWIARRVSVPLSGQFVTQLTTHEPEPIESPVTPPRFSVALFTIVLP